MKSRGWIRLAAAAIVALLFAMPVLWMIATSFKPPAEFVSESIALLPVAPTTEHYRAIASAHVAANFAASLVVAAGTVALALAAGFPAAYALARARLPARLDAGFLAFVLLLKLTPPIVLAVPLFQVLRTLGLIDTLAGLVLTYQAYTLPMAIWLLLGFVREVPTAYEETAEIDGAALPRRLWSIVLPIMRPGLLATTALLFVVAWNEFLFALLFIQTPSLFPLPLFIATRITEEENLWGQLMAVGVLAALPAMLCLGALLRHFGRAPEAGLTG